MKEKVKQIGDKKFNFLSILSWCLFDWGQSAFPTVIITFIFGTYFVRSVSTSSVHGTALWGWAMGISSVFVSLLSPILGSIADHTGRRKLWLAFFVMCNALATSLLYFTKPSPKFLLWALVWVGFANICYEFMQVFYNAMLTSITSKGKIGRISGWGWAFGYFGGLACLSVALFAFIQSKWLPSINEVNVRSSTLLVAFWVLVFSLPLFLFTQDVIKNKLPAKTAISRGLADLINTFKELKQHRNIFIFLVARLFYIDGLNTLFVFAGIYAGSTFNMNYIEILAFAMILNICAGIGSVYFAWIDDRWGPKKVITLSLVMMIITGTALLLIRDKSLFWVLSAVLGIFVGPTQSASRSYMAHSVPEHLTNQMFGIYQLSGRITSFLGPIMVASLTEAFNSQRIGMSAVFILMLLGLCILQKTPKVGNSPT